MWTIMAAAKLDHSRVLVTKFHQNRSMLKGRSAGQRHTNFFLQYRGDTDALEVYVLYKSTFYILTYLLKQKMMDQNFEI